VSGWAWCCACAPAAGKYVIAYGLRSGGNYVRDVDVYDAGSWTSKADGVAPGRTGHRSATLSQKGYVFGGFEGTSPFNMTRNDEYVQSSDVWTTKTAMSAAKAYHSGCAASGQAYAFAGYSDVNAQTFSDATYQYDTGGDSWSTKASCPFPSRQLATAIEIGAKAYLICGIALGGTIMSDNDEYDPSGNSWTAKTDCVSPARHASSGFQISSKGYITYGNLGGSYIRDTDQYVPDTWTSKADGPSPARWYQAGAYYGGAGYATGGQGSSGLLSDHSEFTPDVWATKITIPSPARQQLTSFEAA